MSCDTFVDIKFTIFQTTKNISKNKSMQPLIYDKNNCLTLTRPFVKGQCFTVQWERLRDIGVINLAIMQKKKTRSQDQQVHEERYYRGISFLALQNFRRIMGYYIFDTPGIVFVMCEC